MAKQQRNVRRRERLARRRAALQLRNRLPSFDIRAAGGAADDVADDQPNSRPAHVYRRRPGRRPVPAGDRRRRPGVQRDGAGGHVFERPGRGHAGRAAVGPDIGPADPDRPGRRQRCPGGRWFAAGSPGQFGQHPGVRGRGGRRRLGGARRGQHLGPDRGRRRHAERHRPVHHGGTARRRFRQ